MKKGMIWSGLTTMVAVLVLALAGCAVVKEVQKSEASDTEQLLAAAGFKVRPADTPKKMAHLQTLTQRKLITHQRGGKVYYVYADALNCKCLYVGNQAAYQCFQEEGFIPPTPDRCGPSRPPSFPGNNRFLSNFPFL